MIPAFGLLLIHAVELSLSVHEVLGHEDDENAPHAVEAKALGCFIANDIGDARRHLVRNDGCGSVFTHN